MNLGLSGKRALVTGSTSGIGEAIATMLAQEGCRVAVHGRDRERTEAVSARITARGGDVMTVIGDLADDAGADHVASTIERAWSGVDVLVNNAGGDPGTAKMNWETVDSELWFKTYSMNVVSAMRLIRRLAPGMRERRWGRIIQISSAGAAQPPPVAPDYCAAKAAVSNLTVNLSQSLAGTGVTVNTVSPGMTLTAALQAWLRAMAQTRGWTGLSDDEIASRLTGKAGGIGRPHHIAHAICMIAGEGGAFINGANIRVDGGQVATVN